MRGTQRRCAMGICFRVTRGHQVLGGLSREVQQRIMEIPCIFIFTHDSIGSASATDLRP